MASDTARGFSRVIPEDGPDSAYCYDAGLASLRFLENRFDEARPICEGRRSVLPFFGCLAWCHAETGRDDDAAAIVRNLRPDHFGGIPRDHGWLVTVAFLAKATACLEDSDAASELYDLLLPCRDEVIA